ncbi:MAG: hypothetical protein ABIC95_02395 [archaeon]
MKITIDTKEESTKDIRKLIRMLQHIVGSESSYSTMDNGTSEESREPVVNPGLFSMFDDNDTDRPGEPEPEEEEPTRVQVVEY